MKRRRGAWAVQARVRRDGGAESAVRSPWEAAWGTALLHEPEELLRGRQRRRHGGLVWRRTSRHPGYVRTSRVWNHARLHPSTNYSTPRDEPRRVRGARLVKPERTRRRRGRGRGSGSSGRRVVHARSHLAVRAGRREGGAWVPRCNGSGSHMNEHEHLKGGGSFFWLAFLFFPSFFFFFFLFAKKEGERGRNPKRSRPPRDASLSVKNTAACTGNLPPGKLYPPRRESAQRRCPAC